MPVAPGETHVETIGHREQAAPRDGQAVQTGSMLGRVAMRFQGWLRSPGEAHRGLPVVLEVEETAVTIFTGGSRLGLWSLALIDLQPAQGNAFLLRVEDEDWLFEPEEPTRLLFEGIPSIKAGRAELVKATPRGPSRRGGSSDPADLGGVEPKGSWSPMPSLIWGLLTAALVFAAASAGVLIGRMRADGPNLLTGGLVFGILLAGFLWGRLLWQNASRRRVDRSTGPIGPIGTPPPADVAGRAGAARALPASTSAGANPSGPDAPLPQTADVARSTRGRPSQRGLTVRGDRGVLGLVFHESMQEANRSEPAAKPQRPPPPPVDRDAPDDLTAIKGVGPRMESILHGLGHTTYADIALLSNEEIAEIQEELGSFKNRIYRDGWCLSATRLHRQKYGSFPARRVDSPGN